MTMDRMQVYRTLNALCDRPDEAATRELAAFFEGPDPAVRMDAARALCERVLPEDVRRRVAALLGNAQYGDGADLEGWPLQCAAKALLSQDASRAFQEAEPLLRGQALETPLGERTGAALLSELEDVLAHASALTGAERERALPDPRFRALAEDIQRSHQELRFLATLVVDGFRYFQGEDIRPPVRHVELGEDEDPPFPFLVAGFPTEGSTQRAEIAAALEAQGRRDPDGLGWFHHQYGGLSCLQASFLGYGLRVPESPPLTEALQSLIHTWYGTSGEQMDSPELGDWSERLRELLPPPGAESGAEALLVSYPGVPFSGLRGREVMAFGATRAPWRGRTDTGFDPDISPGGRFSEAHEQRLTSLGAALGLGLPRLILLWGNSD